MARMLHASELSPQGIQLPSPSFLDNQVSCLHRLEQAALGGGLAEIAGAKAGIMKPGVPLVLGRQPEPEAAAALRAAAAELNCPVRSQSRHPNPLPFVSACKRSLHKAMYAVSCMCARAALPG